MKKLLVFLSLFIAVKTIALATSVDTIHYGNFGKIVIYKPGKTPDAAVLFVSGDSGWNKGIGNIANQIVAQGALVAGIDIRYYFKNLKKQHGKCYYPAGDFELLSLFLQKKYKFHNYYKPILMGYSSGATLVYGTLVQAPANTFKGAIAMGFCPDLATNKPLCPGNGLNVHSLSPGANWYLEASDNLTAPFIVLLGMNDKVCPYKHTEAFMKKVKDAELILLPKIAHGMSVKKNYLPYLLYAYNKVKKSLSYQEMVATKNQLFKQQPPAKLDSNLPLTEFQAKKNDALPLVFFISGDGGWTGFDEGVAENLTEKGVPVIGLDAQKYFWQPRTPDQTAFEITKALRHYLLAFNKKTFVLCGYSFGADIIPFLTTRLPADLKPFLKSVVMMSPDPEADFEIHVADMLSLGSGSDKYKVLIELKKVAKSKVVCIFGAEEDSGDPALFKSAGSEVVLLPGAHHYDNNFSAITNEIIKSFH
jgi:type IV secretory pathway VirJ component